MYLLIQQQLIAWHVQISIKIQSLPLIHSPLICQEENKLFPYWSQIEQTAVLTASCMDVIIHINGKNNAL